MEVEFCLEAVEEALARHGRPEIFNTDQGSQFTSADFTGLLIDNAIAISMDGKGAWRDNVFVERLWRSVKYEEVYLRAYDSVGEARASIGRYLDFYNRKRPHSSLDARTPDQRLLRTPAAGRGSMNFAAVFGASLRSGYALPACHPENASPQRQPAEVPLINRGNLSRQSQPALTATTIIVAMTKCFLLLNHAIPCYHRDFIAIAPSPAPRCAAPSIAD